MLKDNLFKQDEAYKNFTPSKSDAIKLTYIKKRYEEMKNARTVISKDRETYQEMIDANFAPYPDGRSSSTVPLASTIIELFVAEATKIKTEFQFKSETSEYQTQAKALEYAWKYDRRRNKRMKAFTDNEYITAGFGTSIMYTGFESYDKVQKDPIMDELTGEIKREEKEYKEEEIIVKNVDIRNFYIDNQVIDDIGQAVDCILIQWISYDKFMGMKENPMYKNIDKIAPKEYSLNDATFITKEEQTKQGQYIELTHYWNVEKDAYMVMANDILIREHPMTSTIDGKKALPFVVRILGKKNYSIYGRGFCESLLMFNSEINNLRELLMDGIRRSNSQVLAIGNGLSFDGRTFSYDNEILTFDGNLANNFQQLSGNPPNQAIFNYIDRLYKDISVYVGIDIQNMFGEPGQTAFQTEVQRESSQKRVNVWLTNRDLANERFADLYKDLIQTYFPRKDINGLYPKLEVEDEELVDKKGKKTFRKKKGKNTFEVTPELLRGDINIDVHTNTTAPTINAVDREQKMQFLNAAGTIAQSFMMAKQSGMDIEKIMPATEVLRDLASDFNLNTQDKGKDDQDELKEKKQEFMQQLQSMGGGGASPSGVSPEQAQPEGPLAINQPQEGQPLG